ncbi:MAG: STAS domain-containing protein [Bryobacteraceae bacterium]
MPYTGFVGAHVDISTREKEGITILDLDGRLVVSESLNVLRETVNQLLREHRLKIVANLAGVDYIDSTGLGTLVVCYTTLQRAGGSLRLLNLNRRNIELLLLTKLSTVFELFNDEQSAINSFFPEREIQHFDILSFVQDQKAK